MGGNPDLFGLAGCDDDDDDDDGNNNKNQSCNSLTSPTVYHICFYIDI